MEFLISLLGASLMISIIGCGLYLVMRWPAETEDVKTQDTREEKKNARIARELEQIRKGGYE
jgi:hypothetical protein